MSKNRSQECNDIYSCCCRSKCHLHPITEIINKCNTISKGPTFKWTNYVQCNVSSDCLQRSRIGFSSFVMNERLDMIRQECMNPSIHGRPPIQLPKAFLVWTTPQWPLWAKQTIRSCMDQGTTSPKNLKRHSTPSSSCNRKQCWISPERDFLTLGQPVWITCCSCVSLKSVNGRAVISATIKELPTRMHAHAQ